MEPISNADRLAALLRQRLKERARTEGGSKSARNSGSGSAPKGAAAVRALAAVEGVDNRQMRRTVIQHLLADQFGEQLVNEAQFQQIVTRVADAIEEDGAAAALLDTVMRDLRSG